MKLRYYLRGLGTGILVTALILGRLISESRPLTDAEIKAKALALGMVDANSLSLSDVSGSEGGPQYSVDIDPETDSLESEEMPVREDNDLSVSPTPNMAFEPDAGETSGTDSGILVNPEITDSPEPVETVLIEIFRGDSSHTVSVRLEEAGLVTDAWEFDDYLVDNGYSRSIRAGTYMIPVGASWEEIVDIIA